MQTSNCKKYDKDTKTVTLIAADLFAKYVQIYLPDLFSKLTRIVMSRAFWLLLYFLPLEELIETMHEFCDHSSYRKSPKQIFTVSNGFAFVFSSLIKTSDSKLLYPVINVLLWNTITDTGEKNHFKAYIRDVYLGPNDKSTNLTRHYNKQPMKISSRKYMFNIIIYTARRMKCR